MERVESNGDIIITAVHVYLKDKSMSFHAVPFIRTKQDKIISAACSICEMSFQKNFLTFSGECYRATDKDRAVGLPGLYRRSERIFENSSPSMLAFLQH